MGQEGDGIIERRQQRFRMYYFNTFTSYSIYQMQLLLIWKQLESEVESMWLKWNYVDYWRLKVRNYIQQDLINLANWAI